MKKILTLSAIMVAASFASQASAQDYYSGNQIRGGLAGAVIGGVLGSNLSGTGVQDEGTAIGAVAGALIGSQLAGRNNERHHTTSRPYVNTRPYYNSQPHYRPAPTYYAPAPSYYAPAPVYYAPSPVYYVPQPRYYSQPRISINVGSYGNSHYRPRHHIRDSHSHYPRHHQDRRAPRRGRH